MESKPLNVFEAPLQGISLVEASAGTGKTYNITSLYVRALLELNLEPSQILVMTFTEAATAELKYRLRKRLRDSLKAIETNNSEKDPFLSELISQNYEEAEIKLKNAIDNFDESSIFTIHGFCNKVLGEHSLHFDIPANFDLLTDPSELLQDCVDDYWRSFISKADDDELKWFLLDYLTDIGFGPDELRKTVEEVFKHPQSKIIPKQFTTEQFKDKLQLLSVTFDQIKKAWKREGDVISDMYLNKKLNGRSFKAGKSWRQDWDNILAFVNSEKLKIGVFDRINRFGTYMRDKGSKSDFTVPDLEFFPLIDTYVEITDQMKLLKAGFINESLTDIKQAFEEKKRTSNVLSYNDLLEITESGLSEDKSGHLSKKLSKKYPVALVDEFQDTDPIQYSILKQIYFERPETALFMIGDPKQAIYGFRGADIFTYIQAKGDTAEEQAFHLTNNYRSNDQMIKGVNSLFTQTDDPFLLSKVSFKRASSPEKQEVKDYIKNKSDEVVNPLQFIAMDSIDYTSKGTIEADIYNTLNNEIIKLLSEDYRLGGERIQEKDIAILVRTGRQGEAIQDSLREIGISSVLRSRTSVFKTKEADELFKILSSTQKLTYEPGIRMALATSMLGYDANDLLRLQEDEKEWSQIIDKIDEGKHIWEEKGVESAIEILCDNFKIRQRLSLSKAAERKIANLVHLTELLTKASREQRLNENALLKWFYMKINEDAGKASSDDEQLRLESDEGLIQIATVHSSKGLQYPIVFCPFLWSSKSGPGKDDILKFNKQGQNYIDISQVEEHPERDKYMELTKKQNQAEDVRLAYVALTRAVSACFVMFPKYNKIDESPISYIISGIDPNSNNDFDSLFSILKKAEDIEVRNPLEVRPGNKPKGSKTSTDTLEVKDFPRQDLFDHPRMLSYSALSSAESYENEPIDYDEVYLQSSTKNEVKYDRFGFPKGANAGSCLHKIFEDIEFQDLSNLQKVIDENLDYFGIDEKWKSVAYQWVKEIMKHQLGESQTSLSAMGESQVLKEMEFFFPVEKVKADQLWKIIRGYHPHAARQEPVHGFMKGYIDLIFESNGKYYILDYKSNYLGDSPRDYSNEALEQIMTDSGYDLQYHLYTLAFHRYLKNRLEGYRYEEHFGGVYYLFLRGVVMGKPGSGVYHDLPGKHIIQQLDDYCLGGEINE